jgi:hypothetical protein
MSVFIHSDTFCRFGHKVIHLHVGSPETTPFAIHEDLLCANSGYFKKLLQKDRKAIEGECSICHNDISRLARVCYCNECGHNFHLKCVDEWLRSKKTCPLCCKRWSTPRTICYTKTYQLQDIVDADLFDIYIQWLYTGTHPFCPRDPDNTFEHRVLLLALHTLGETLEDELFLKTLRKEIVENDRATMLAISYQYVDDAYKLTEGNSVLRKFLVDLYTTQVDPPKLNFNYPPQFTLDVAHALLSRRADTDMKREEILAGYLPEEEVDEEEDVADVMED